MNANVYLVVLSSLMLNSLAVEQNRLIGDLRIRYVLGIFQEYCKETGTNVEWAINESHTISCFNCTCSAANRGILCTGIGYEDGVLPPAGCTKRRLQDFEMGEGEKCCYQMVNEDNQAQVCGNKVCA